MVTRSWIFPNGWIFFAEFHLAGDDAFGMIRRARVEKTEANAFSTDLFFVTVLVYLMLRPVAL